MKKVKKYEDDVEFYGLYWKRRRFRSLEVSKNLKLLEFRRLIRRNIKRGGEVLDVGCGTGELVASLRSKYKVTAFDFSKETIDRNKRLISGVEFLSRNALDLPPVGDMERFDAVTCMDVIEHIPFDMHSQFIYQLSRYMKIGGFLVISTPDRDEALRYKRNPDQPEDEFLKEYEGQPRADCLTKSNLDQLLQYKFDIIYRGAVSPTVTNRSVDLVWKGFSLVSAYRGVNLITRRFGIPCRYLIRAAFRTS